MAPREGTGGLPSGNPLSDPQSGRTQRPNLTRGQRQDARSGAFGCWARWNGEAAWLEAVRVPLSA
jgi:hypothetical protein